MVVAPASMAACVICARNSGSVRERPRAELHVAAEDSLGVLHALDGQPQDFALGLLEFVFQVELGRGQEDVDAAPVAGGFDGGPGGIDVARSCSVPGRR